MLLGKLSRRIKLATRQDSTNRLLSRGDIFTSRILGTLVLLMGLAFLLSAAVHRFSAENYESAIAIDIDSRALTALIGLFLLYVSLQLYARRKVAYIVSLSLTALLFALEISRGASLAVDIIIATVVIMMLLSTRTFTVVSDNTNLRRGTAYAGLILAAVFLYAVIGFYSIDARAYQSDLSLADSVRYALLQLFSFQGPAIEPFTRGGKVFLGSVNLLGTTAFILAVYSLFRPLRFQLAENNFERTLAQRILGIAPERADADDYFKLWPLDKHYYFNEQADVFIAYKVTMGVALALNGPSGNPEHYKATVIDFSRFCQNNGWLPAIVHCDESTARAAETIGYTSLFIGNEAIIDCQAFAGSTQNSKHFRYVANKARREQLAIEEWQAPLSDSQINSLAAISTEWLSERGRREYTFVMGYFDEDYLRQCDCSVVTQAGKPVAYANIVPSFNPAIRTIDHMRHLTDVPSLTVHFLLSQAILRASESRVTSFSLGLAPLSGIENREEGGLPIALLSTLKRFGGRYYSFNGLEQFKNKFDPDWQPRFICYYAPAVKVLAVSQALERASRYKSPKPRSNGRLFGKAGA